MFNYGVQLFNILIKYYAKYETNDAQILNSFASA